MEKAEYGNKLETKSPPLWGAKSHVEYMNFSCLMTAILHAPLMFQFHAGQIGWTGK